MYPNEYNYSKTHEWVLVEGDTAIIGVTHYAQEQLGDIVYLELPEAGSRLEKESVFGTVESVKAVSELYAPVSGEVIEKNAHASDHPEILNQDPHKSGWLVKIRLSNPNELGELMSADRYEKFTAEEAKH